MDLANLIGGPARAYIDVAGTLTDIGHLHGGIDVNIPEPAIMELYADELGETPADGVFNGRSQPDTAVLRLAEVTLENLDRAIPNSTLVTNGVDPTKKRLEIRAIAGTTLSANSAKYVIKPIDKATGAPTAEENDWVTIPKGVAVGAVNIAYKKGEQRVIEITLRCLPDGANNNRTIFWGDSTA